MAFYTANLWEEVVADHSVCIFSGGKLRRISHTLHAKEIWPADSPSRRFLQENSRHKQFGFWKILAVFLNQPVSSTLEMSVGLQMTTYQPVLIIRTRKAREASVNQIFPAKATSIANHTILERYVQVGRVVRLNNGPLEGKLAVIVEIVDHNRVSRKSIKMHDSSS